MSLFDRLPYMVTTASVIAVTNATFDSYANPIWTEGSESTTVGFFEIGGRRGYYMGGQYQGADFQESLTMLSGTLARHRPPTSRLTTSSS